MCTILNERISVFRFPLSYTYRAKITMCILLVKSKHSDNFVNKYLLIQIPTNACKNK